MYAGELSFEKEFIISVNDVIETGISDIKENRISTARVRVEKYKEDLNSFTEKTEKL